MAASRAELDRRTVHLWRAPLDVDPATLSWLSTPLCDAELERARRFASAADRDRWAAARGWLRRLLACYLSRDPAGLRLRVSPSGKPALEPPAQWLRFNVSHSGDLAMFALARDREVGVDVERVDTSLGTDPVPARFLTGAERSALAGLAPELRAPAALRCWTAKEAYVKALGAGLGAQIAELDASALVTGDFSAGPRSAALGHADWSVHGVDAGPGYVAAAVAQGRDARVPWRAEPVGVPAVKRP